MTEYILVMIVNVSLNLCISAQLWSQRDLQTYASTSGSVGVT